MEIESKYTVPDSATFDRLLALTELGGYVLRPAGEQTLTDHYLDTPSRAIARGGYACRLREREGRWRATVKSLGAADGAVHQREEYETDVAPGASPADWPDGPGRDRILALINSGRLGELFVIRQRRTVREVWQAERAVGEWALDVVDMEAGKRAAVSRELEIELAPAGTLDDLRALGEALRPFALHPQPLSKFERALALLDETESAKHKTPGVRADDAMAEAGRKILRFHFKRMTAHEAGTRSGQDPEDLHDMRVATRRQRAALRLFAPCFKPKVIRPFRRALKQLAACLGAVRDVDVLLAAARAYQETLADPVPLQSLVDELTRARESARAELLEHLESDDYRAFLARYENFLETEGKGVSKAEPTDGPQPQSVQHALPGQLWEHYARVGAYAPVLPWADIPTLHTLRIEAKRLRYALEFFRDVLPSGIEENIRAIVALQDHLGELHDTDVALGRVRDFLLRGVQTQLAPEAMGAAGRYLDARQKQLARLRRTVGQPWRKVTGKRFKQVLAKAVAGL